MAGRASAPEADGRRPLALRGGTVVTMEPGLGELSAADVVVIEGRIAAIEAGASAPDDALEIDARDHILLPGFVDGHRHCWQGALRRLIPDADLPQYMAVTHDGVARHYEPEDMYIGDLTALLGALDCGFTSVLDLSHNTRSRAHADAVLRASRDAGIRVVHASAPPNAGDWEGHWPDDLTRLRAVVDQSPLLTLRMAIDMRRIRPIEELLGIARSLGLGVTIDGVMGAGSSAELVELGRAGLLGPDVTIVHATSLTASAWEQLEAAGVRITLATTSDEQLGLAGAIPPVQEVMDAGVTPGLSVDVEIALAGDPFTQMRATMITQRAMAAAAVMAGGADRRRLESAEVLRWATVGGAEAIGLGDRVGSLAVGKEADIVMLDAADAVTIPTGNAIATIVHGGDRAGVRGVFVGGAVRKWDGRLVGVDLERIRAEALASRTRLLERAGFDLDLRGLHGVPELQDASLRDYLGRHDDAV